MGRVFETHRHSSVSADLCCAGGSRRLEPPYAEMRLGRVRADELPYLSPPESEGFLHYTSDRLTSTSSDVIVRALSTGTALPEAGEVKDVPTQEDPELEHLPGSRAIAGLHQGLSLRSFGLHPAFALAWPGVQRTCRRRFHPTCGVGLPVSSPA